ncbi:uncharacterized protein AKAW2_11819A [Aspergillus luchuensis]|uniref:Uncharacterized protein n=1 Tax=Aspergillus kawachii TaxID=1069201 RepID=A0A146F0H4_ASPKA|nr:uncharacterized protein AKAW2_11819A [Aspergillus luchuensis]BCR94773.1 hypothetical protein AKAW2_11819A [Aspergillus luchuensis]GAA86200.1 hypothetical protein AKAW_04314 [Aspergillus luchuensis IFO 4308]GAT19726.1 hypothetical protein RIB2604_00603070 [Aspergillus luchuensis]
MDSPRLKAEEIPISTQSPSNNIVVPTLDAYVRTLAQAMIRMVVTPGHEDSNWTAGEHARASAWPPKRQQEHFTR